MEWGEELYVSKDGRLYKVTALDTNCRYVLVKWAMRLGEEGLADEIIEEASRSWQLSITEIYTDNPDKKQLE